MLMLLLFTLNTHYTSSRLTLAELLLMYSSLMKRFDMNETSKTDIVGSRTWLALCIPLPEEMTAVERTTGRGGAGIIVSYLHS